MHVCPSATLARQLQQPADEPGFIGIESSPSSLLDERAVQIKDVARFVRQISEAIEEVVVKDDVLAASIEGIEISLLWLRL